MNARMRKRTAVIPHMAAAARKPAPMLNAVISTPAMKGPEDWPISMIELRAPSDAPRLS